MEISGSAGASGLQALQSAQLRIDQATNQIAQNQVTQNNRTDERETRVEAQSEPQRANGNDDQINAQIELQQGGQQAQAAANVLRVEDKVIGSLLDIRA